MAIEIRGMAPLLQVFDMPASIVFYLAMYWDSRSRAPQPGKERFDWALLTLNGVELMLNTAYEERDRGRQHLIPLALLLMRIRRFHFGCPDVDAAYAHLRARGVAAKE